MDSTFNFFFLLTNFISQDLIFFSFLLGPFAFIFSTAVSSSVDPKAARAHLHLCNKTGKWQGERGQLTVMEAEAQRSESVEAWIKMLVLLILARLILHFY